MTDIISDRYEIETELRLKYCVTKIPNIENVIRSLQALNEISLALGKDISRNYKCGKIDVSLDVSNLTRGSFQEDIVQKFIFGSKEKYDATMKWLGELPMPTKVLLVIMGLATYHFISNYGNDKPVTYIDIGDNNIFNFSDGTVKTFYKNIPDLVAISKAENNAAIEIGDIKVTSEMIERIPNSYEEQQEIKTVSLDDADVNIRTISYDENDRSYGIVEDDKFVKKQARIEFLNAEEADYIKKKINYSETVFSADIDVELKLNKKNKRYEPRLIIIKSLNIDE